MSTLKEDLLELRELKIKKEKLGREKKKADAEFNQLQARTFERMEAEGIDSMRDKGTGTLFSSAETIYGQIQDRSKFVEWALENDPELVENKERKELINALARRLLDDEEAFPPGLTFRPKRYISQNGGGDSDE